ncbi:LLM class F420-dependent oxidoreductase [Nocardiopsis gilva YIM 90087]|uniref:LLM class F420-dependent oxidoreductase n=1 Tax=Nocardiopsis gilva YIM 90087 TaxID=1235441 RepID=A0A223S8Z7_9ACTN|nr:TIGR03620 family F420-dependent LLM class oxidoreductase [Nocardiopsis gilva]ASU84569.1 LLM class F420-dependent oxidoreductase [Nocardiopsis gilva YIM 90087]
MSDQHDLADTREHGQNSERAPSAAPRARRADTADLKRRLGPIGVWFGHTLAVAPAATVRQAARELERLGYGALWFGGDGPGTKEAVSQAAILLSATERTVVATGIASIWSRDALAAATAATSLAEAWPDRFLLGLGVSHAKLVAARGSEYRKPLTAMRSYLDAMDAVDYPGEPQPAPAPRVLAALRPKMVGLARDRANGAHTYFTTPAHTARVRATLGSEPLLAPEQAVVLDTDPRRARATARGHMARYLALPNYVNSLRELGWDDADFADGGSDALVDAIVPWGEPDTIAARLREHRDAGADHVAVQPLAATLPEQVTALGELAPVLLG